MSEAALAAVFVRFISFTLFFSLGTRGLISWITKTALIVILIVFSLPLIIHKTGENLLTTLLLTGEFAPEQFLSLNVLLVELSNGALIGVVYSVAALVALLLGRWISQCCGLILPATTPKQNCQSKAGSEKNSLATFFSVIFLFLFFSTPACSKMVQIAVAGIFSMPPGKLVFGGSAETFSNLAAKHVISTAGLAISSALFLAIPFFLLSILVDYSALVLNRFLKGVVSAETVACVKMPLVILLLSLSLAPVIGGLGQILEQSFSKGAFSNTTIAAPATPKVSGTVAVGGGR